MPRESQKRWKSRSNSLFWRNWAVELECASDEMTILNSYVDWWYINYESQLVSHCSRVQLWLSFCESFILVFLDSICLFFKINRNKLTSKHPSMMGHHPTYEFKIDISSEAHSSSTAQFLQNKLLFLLFNVVTDLTVLCS